MGSVRVLAAVVGLVVLVPLVVMALDWLWMKHRERSSDRMRE